MIMGGPPTMGLTEVLTIPHREKQLVMKYYKEPRNWLNLVITVTNLWAPYKAGNFVPS
jgi:hypothetical protein